MAHNKDSHAALHPEVALLLGTLGSASPVANACQDMQ